MGKRPKFDSLGSRPMNEYEFRVYDSLVRKHDFMRFAEIAEECELSPPRVLPILDRLYGSRLIMARFAIKNQAIIVTCDEVRIPEVGFSRQLDKLLIGVGMSKDNWVDTVKSYATLDQNGDFPSFEPDGIAP